MDSSKAPAERSVKGNVILDYVKMIRANPHLPWKELLKPEEWEQINRLILPASWYPLPLFQRVGLAVFKLVAKENYALLHAYGRSLADQMHADNPGLVVKGRPRDTLHKYRAIQDRLYSFKGLDTVDISPQHMIAYIYSQPEDIGIPVYLEQISGTIERLVELSGGRQVQVKLIESVLKGAKQNTLEITWEEGHSPNSNRDVACDQSKGY